MSNFYVVNNPSSYSPAAGKPYQPTSVTSLYICVLSLCVLLGIMKKIVYLDVGALLGGKEEHILIQDLVKHIR